MIWLKYTCNMPTIFRPRDLSLSLLRLIKDFIWYILMWRVYLKKLVLFFLYDKYQVYSKSLKSRLQWLFGSHFYLQDLSYIIIIIIIIKACWRHGFLWYSLSIRSYRLSSLVSLLDGIRSPHRVNKCNFLLVGQHWCVNM